MLAFPPKIGAWEVNVTARVSWLARARASRTCLSDIDFLQGDPISPHFLPTPSVRSLKHGGGGGLGGT